MRSSGTAVICATYLLARAGELRIGEFLEEHVGLPVQNAMALLDHGEADRLGQVALPRSATH
jgi:hypothetical protein